METETTRKLDGIEAAMEAVRTRRAEIQGMEKPSYPEEDEGLAEIQMGLFENKMGILEEQDGSRGEGGEDP